MRRIGGLGLVAAVVALTAAACGGGEGSSADGGGNVDTVGPVVDGASDALHLQGYCAAKNVDNRDTGNALRVDCLVNLTRGGTKVVNGQVRINPAPPGLQVQLLANADGNYEGYYLAYAGSARVSAVSGEDTIEETPFAGPAVFQVTSPTAGSTLPADAPVHVEWTHAGDATNVGILATNNAIVVNDLPDSGSYDLPAGTLVGEDVLMVRRWRTTPITAAAPGSEMGFAVDVPIAVTIEGAPLLDAALPDGGSPPDAAP